MALQDDQNYLHFSYSCVLLTNFEALRYRNEYFQKISCLFLGSFSNGILTGLGGDAKIAKVLHIVSKHVPLGFVVQLVQK